MKKWFLRRLQKKIFFGYPSCVLKCEIGLKHWTAEQNLQFSFGNLHAYVSAYSYVYSSANKIYKQNIYCLVQRSRKIVVVKDNYQEGCKKDGKNLQKIEK